MPPCFVFTGPPPVGDSAAQVLEPEVHCRDGTDVTRDAAGNVAFVDGQGRRRTFPRVIGLGPSKTGSSALWVYLNSHKDAVPIPSATWAVKELGFFQSHRGRLPPNRGSPRPGDCRWYEGLGCYLPEDIPRGSFWLDVSPLYASTPQAADRVRAVNPEARLILTVRDPVEAVWSSYNYFTKLEGRESSPEEFSRRMAEAIEGIETCTKRSSWASARGMKWDPACSYHFSYLGAYIYHDMLLNWRSVFPAEQILVLSSSRLRDDTRKVMEEVEAFLGLPDGGYGAVLDDAVNAGDAVGTGTRGEKTHKSPYGPIPEDAKALLATFYSPHNARFNALIGRVLL